MSHFSSHLDAHHVPSSGSYIYSPHDGFKDHHHHPHQMGSCMDESETSLTGLDSDVSTAVVLVTSGSSGSGAGDITSVRRGGMSQEVVANPDVTSLDVEHPLHPHQIMTRHSHQLESQGSGPNHHLQQQDSSQHLMFGTSGVNSSMTPIDKLYSMQNSYFSSGTDCECLGSSGVSN